VKPFVSSSDLIQYVRDTPGALGIVGVAHIRDLWSAVTVYGLGTPGTRPDTTEPVGRYYTPHQAHVFRDYYPISRMIYIYTRDVAYNVGFGFISFATSSEGQKVFVNNGLVPVTMPVRLVELTSRQVQ
jgi:phosphate transport system substrate-binding protein